MTSQYSNNGERSPGERNKWLSWRGFKNTIKGENKKKNSPKNSKGKNPYQITLINDLAL